MAQMMLGTAGTNPCLRDEAVSLLFKVRNRRWGKAACRAAIRGVVDTNLQMPWFGKPGLPHTEHLVDSVCDYADLLIHYKA